MTTSVDLSTSTYAELRELYLVRQDNNGDADCSFPWCVDSLRLEYILRRLHRVPERVWRCVF
jgi:hypothetical protein